ETHSLPRWLAATLRDFTSYVAGPRQLHSQIEGRARSALRAENGRQRSAVPTIRDLQWRFRIAGYWIQTVTELRDEFIGSSKIDNVPVDMFSEYCADPTWLTLTIAFMAVHSWAPVG